MPTGGKARYMAEEQKPTTQSEKQNQPVQQPQVPQQTQKKHGCCFWIAICGIVLFIGLIAIVGVVCSPSEKEPIEPQKEIKQEEPKEETKKEPLPYEIFEEKDISYAGCKRTAISILVPDNSTQDDVDYTLETIINAHKNEWQDITVWAWKQSEKDIVGKTSFTMGMKEYSTCE